jgi:hypothetical protein
MARTLPSARRSATILLGAIFLAILALAIGWPAAAQDPTAVVAAAASGGDAQLVDLAGRLGLPGVLLLLGLRLGQVVGQAIETLKTWRPEVRVTLVCPQQGCLDAIRVDLATLRRSSDLAEARAEVAERTAEAPRAA